MSLPNQTHLTAIRLYREAYGRILATLVRLLGDFGLAEECLQEAFATALKHWPDSGIPEQPRAWLIQTAKNKAIDHLRRQRRLTELPEDLDRLAALAYDPPEPRDAGWIADDRLRLIFTCCHPALAPESQVALTLHAVGGLNTEEIARAFLTTLPTMAQRLVRTKRKISEAGIPYRIPEAEQLAERIGGVLSVLYLIFNEGYSATSGHALLNVDLSSMAITLTRDLFGLLPNPEVGGLLALMLLHDARRAARTDAQGDLVMLEEQDRTKWNRAQIAEGERIIESVLRQAPPGPYALQAAIAAVHAQTVDGKAADWPQLVALYDRLLAQLASPVVELNRAVAVAMVDGADAGLALIDAIAACGALRGYYPLHAARADLLRRSTRYAEAALAYARAAELTLNTAERRFLNRRREEMQGYEGRTSK